MKNIYEKNMNVLCGSESANLYLTMSRVGAFASWLDPTKKCNESADKLARGVMSQLINLQEEALENQ